MESRYLSEDVAFLESYLKFNSFAIESFCFDKQIAFIQDKAKYKIAVCSRRAGKTVGCAAHLVSTALANPNRVCLYITLSRINAKHILWPDLLAINRDFKLGGITNETELSIKFPNLSIVRLSGAKDSSEVEKLRGHAFTLVYIDEAQSFRDYIRNLIEEVISKALFDYDGTLCLTGTPSPVPTGYFYECWSSPSWAKHHWTMFDNPYIEKKSGKTAEALVRAECERKGVSKLDPTIQRECYGQWVVDSDALVFKYDPIRNHYADLPLSNGWHYILGVDLGFDDSDAIAVIAWDERFKETYLVEERIESKQGITDLASQLSLLITKYNPDSVIMDTGGLGKKIANEINQRFGLPIKAAEKVRKFEFIELLNDALRTGRFLASNKSRFAQDCMLVEWDKDSTQLKVSDRYHSDINDAVLYAFRESLHWMHQPAVIKPKSQSPEWFKLQEDKIEKQLEDKLERDDSMDDGTLYSIGLSDDKEWD